MNAAQRRIYNANMQLGALIGVNGGASVWRYYPPPTGKGVTSAPTLTQDGTIQGYVLQIDLSKWGQPLPPQPVGAIGYRFEGFVDTVVAAGAVIVDDGTGTLAFSIGELSSAQGWPSGLVVKCDDPELDPNVTTYTLIDGMLT